MDRKPVITENEISFLTSNSLSNGVEDTYNKISAKMFMDLDAGVFNLDRVLLDKAEDILDMARKNLSENPDDVVYKLYLELHRHMRYLAHKLYYAYKNKGIEGKDERILKIVK